MRSIFVFIFVFVVLVTSSYDGGCYDSSMEVHGYCSVGCHAGI